MNKINVETCKPGSHEFNWAAVTETGVVKEDLVVMKYTVRWELVNAYPPGTKRLKDVALPTAWEAFLESSRIRGLIVCAQYWFPCNDPCNGEVIEDIIGDIEAPTHTTFGGDVSKIRTDILKPGKGDLQNTIVCKHTIGWELVTADTKKALETAKGGRSALLLYRKEEAWWRFLCDVKVDKLIHHMCQAIMAMPQNSFDQAQRVEEVERLIADIQSVDMQ